MVKGKAKSGAKVKEIKMKFCPNCLEYCEIKATRCPACDTPFSSGRSEVLGMKNLTTRSFEGNIDGSTEHKVIKVEVLKHVAKSGNDCVRLDYSLSGLFPRHVSEFFLPSTAWGFAKLKSRLSVLGIGVFTEKTIGTVLVCSDKNLVIKLVKNHKGYHEVQSLESRNINPK
jgi:hypothetical protein